MSKIRLTKNELKGQKESLVRFRRYLPMLILKKKQFQLEIIKLYQAIKDLAGQTESLRNQVLRWVDVFAQEVPVEEFLKVAKIKTVTDNVAGIDIPVFSGVDFSEKEYDLLLTPLWVDSAIEALKETIILKAKMLIYHQQMEILKEELRIATQRVNLFEKVKIPESKENIRVIQIYLGELQTAGVVRGKIAKAKLERKKELVNS
ncbi:MAG: V-type ATP synthase subunit D [Candidatus Omnitrophica bacterium]|nr:V-type ATP synthase subunit D [Candidatus Omnitrophota bacterium]